MSGFEMAIFGTILGLLSTIIGFVLKGISKRLDDHDDELREHDIAIAQMGQQNKDMIRRLDAIEGKLDVILERIPCASGACPIK